MKRLPLLIVTAVVICLDLVTKGLAFRHLTRLGLSEGEVDWVFGDWFGWAIVRNYGVTGGMGSSLSPWVITVLTLIAVLGILLYMLRAKVMPKVVGAALALILGGAAGNLYDRLLYGYVRDFVDVWPRLPWISWLQHWPTFNVADAAIVVGVSFLVFDTIFLSKKRRPAPSEA